MAPAELSDPPRLASHAGRERMEFARSPLDILRGAEPQALAVTYWFDAAPAGDPYPVRVVFAGRFRGEPPAAQQDSFNVLGIVERVLPGSGRVAVTARAPDLPAGDWEVTATPVAPAPPGSSVSWVPVQGDAALPVASAVGSTTFAPVARVLAPGARLGVWPALVFLGAVLAWALQSLLALRLTLPLDTLLPISLVACLLGLLGAKSYYVVTHPKAGRGLAATGMSVQGFVIVAVGVLVGGALLFGLPVGAVLDGTVPGILAGMTVGRLGCLFAGCCAGRPTSSRWGLWSSDRRLGQRRIPVQLLESAMAGGLAVLTLTAVLLWGSLSGIVFVIGIAAYTLGRQLLFPLRGLSRTTKHGRIVTLVTSAAVLVGSLAVASGT